jgi:small-conductance mechanosensitive channel
VGLQKLTFNAASSGICLKIFSVFQHELNSLEGSLAQQSILGGLTWSNIESSLIFLMIGLGLHLGLKKIFKKKQDPQKHVTLQEINLSYERLQKPLILILWAVIGYLMMGALMTRWFMGHAMGLEKINRLMDLILMILGFWVVFQWTYWFEGILETWKTRTVNLWNELFIQLAGKILRILIVVISVDWVITRLNLSMPAQPIMTQIINIVFIIAIALVFYEIVQVGEKTILKQYGLDTTNNLQARKIHTHVRVIGRILYSLIAFFTLISILMLFKSVRDLGASLLASAGVAGIVLGFAVQKTIANFFAGIQIALTQPIRMDDVVVIEGEWGRIEEITLTYVILHIWDDRRLVIPLSYFIEKPFQNWTRLSSKLIGAVFIWVDYTVPLEELRKMLKDVIETQPLWDQRLWNLQVTDSNEQAMQLRILVTAKDSAQLWDLRCAIREKVVIYLQQQYPQSLPKVRAEISTATFSKNFQEIKI